MHQRLQHTCVLADDHDAIRDGLRARLESEGVALVVGEARSTSQATMLCEELRPTLLVLDLRMRDGDGDGFKVLDRIRERRMNTRTLVFSAHSDPTVVERALNAGAMGFVCKDSERPVLMDAIRAALDNRRYVDPSLTASLLASPDSLTDREYDVLKLMGEGMQNEAVAAALELSVETVKTHVSSVLRKLDASTRTQAVVHAFRRGLLQ